jgi:hypothetical protein
VQAVPARNVAKFDTNTKSNPPAVAGDNGGAGKDSGVSSDAPAEKSKSSSDKSVGSSSDNSDNGGNKVDNGGSSDANSAAEPNKNTDGSVTVTPDGVVMKKRGRPPGLKKQPHWKKPGPKPRRGRARANISEEEALHLEMRDNSILKAEGETALTFTVKVTASEAFYGPNAVKHVESD